MFSRRKIFTDFYGHHLEYHSTADYLTRNNTARKFKGAGCGENLRILEIKEMEEFKNI